MNLKKEVFKKSPSIRRFLDISREVEVVGLQQTLGRELPRGYEYYVFHKNEWDNILYKILMRAEREPLG